MDYPYNRLSWNERHPSCYIVRKFHVTKFLNNEENKENKEKDKEADDLS